MCKKPFKTKVISMKIAKLMMLMLVVLAAPACGCKKKCHTTERVSGVETALDLK
jgi:hypothetical protein